jgi:hypothetical protein
MRGRGPRRGGRERPLHYQGLPKRREGWPIDHHQGLPETEAERLGVERGELKSQELRQFAILAGEVLSVCGYVYTWPVTAGYRMVVLQAWRVSAGSCAAS